MKTYIATTCFSCEAPIHYYSTSPEGRPFEVCRECRAWEDEYECMYCDRHPRSNETRIYPHLRPCAHGVQHHHCILPDPHAPWPPWD